MYEILPKKMLTIEILEILRKYSDANHRLTQKDIAGYLNSDYGMIVDRKAIKRNLQNLVQSGYNINFTETNRVRGAGGNEILLTDWYMEHDFTDSELRLMIDSILFSKHIPHSQCMQLIEKIENLSNIYFKTKLNHVYSLPENTPENSSYFLVIETLDEAITNGKQVMFEYNDFHTDKKLHPRLDENGKPKKYLMNPYQMAATNGRYYLICNMDKYEGSANYRIDRISNIEILKSSVKPMEKVKGLENGLDLPKHMAEHVYMFAGPSENVMFKAKKGLLNEIIDWFGYDVEFSRENDTDVVAEVKVNLEAMHHWALRYAEQIKILSPKKLVDEVKEDVTAAAELYSENDGSEESKIIAD